ncbi:MAG: hypothetical protein U1F57_12205 [bacterium]
MTPPGGKATASPLGSGSVFPFPVPLADPTENSDFSDHDRTTAQSLSDLSQGCSDSFCKDSKLLAGQIYLAQNDPQNAQKVFTGYGDDVSAKKDPKERLLARGLLLLSDGKILDAKTYLEPIKSDPVAKTLLDLIDQNDQKMVSLQTLYILKALCDDEKSTHKGDPKLEQIQKFLEEAEGLLKGDEGLSLDNAFTRLSADSTKNYSDLIPQVEALGDGIGGDVLKASRFQLDQMRVQAWYGLVEKSLIPNHRMGTAYMISKILEKDRFVGKSATDTILKLQGIKEDWHGAIAMEVLDGGGTYFLASLIALAPARFATRGTWALWTRWFGTKMPLWKTALGMGVSWLAGTATYYAVEKSTLWAMGYNGAPTSASDKLREFGCDMIVVGLANVLGIGSQRLYRKFFPVQTTPSELFYKRAGWFALRTTGKSLYWGTYLFSQGALLHFNHRWQDNAGWTQRFRPGYPTHLTPASWDLALLERRQIQTAEKTLGQLINHLISIRSVTVTDKLDRRIRDLKKWVGNLNPAADPEQEETLLGVFWVAQERGVFGGGAPDTILKWTREKRFNKVNDYFKKHQIPLQATEDGDFKLITE